MNKARAISFPLLVLISLCVCVPAPVMADDVRIAVRANKGKEAAHRLWDATAAHLGRMIPEHRFIIVPFENNSSLNQAISFENFSFCLTNPAAAVEHQIRYGTRPLATLLNKRQGKGYSRFGSVIFTRAGRDDISKIADLKNKSFMGADELGFGGWRVAWREMLKHDVNPYKDLKALRFAGGVQQRVVYSVLDGSVDAGSVRTDMLERMAARGLIKLKDFKVIGARMTRGFPFLHSTELYPEWLFSAAKDTPDDLRTKVTSALFAIGKNDRAAINGKYIGWISPLDYKPVDDLLRELKVGPYHVSMQGIFTEFFHQYFHFIVILILVVTGLMVTILYMLKMNRRIAKTQKSLKTEIKNRQRAEQVLTSLAQQSLEFSKGASFFSDCLVSLSSLFSAKYAFIGLFADRKETSIKTYAVWAGDRFVDNFEYELEGTPCQDVINLEVELIGENARERYPDDELLVQMGIESYFGAPLISPEGKMMGLISVMDTRPMNPEEGIRPILKIFASRIALEMQRKDAEEELHGMAQQLSYQASHDSLTGLINRREFEIRLKHAWETATSQYEEHALCYLDLDQFKLVNDSCGHGAGDELLKQLAARMAEVVRTSDTLARLGGDEFGVILLDCSLDRARSIAENLLNTVKEFRFSWHKKVFDIGVSIGVVPITRYSLDIYELLRAADTACYVAKNLGRNRVHVFEENDIEIAARRR